MSNEKQQHTLREVNAFTT